MAQVAPPLFAHLDAIIAVGVDDESRLVTMERELVKEALFKADGDVDEAAALLRESSKSFTSLCLRHRLFPPAKLRVVS